MNKRNIYWRVILVTVQALCLTLCLALPAAVPASANPQVDPGINKIYIDTVRDGSFAVSWTTNSASDGSVTWGTSKPPTTVVNDSATNTTTHYVIINGLSPNTTYYFKVTSGTAENDNSGAFYQVTTGPTLSIPTPGKTVWGYVYQSNGSTVVPNAIVYLQLQNNDGSGSTGNSQWVSARTDSSGVWSFDLVNVRTADLQAYYQFTDGTDNMRVIGQGGIVGTRGVDPNPWVMTTPTTDPYQLNIILQQNPTAVKIVDLRAYSAQSVSLPNIVLFLFIASAVLVPGLGWLWFKKAPKMT